MADPVDSLGAFPIIQIAVAGVIAIGGAIMVWRGTASRTRPTAGSGVEWYLDGPVGRIIDLLNGIYRETKELRVDAQRHATENNEKLDELMEITRNNSVRDRPRR